MRARKLNKTLTVSNDEFFEMSNLWPQKTGLAYRIWISVDINHRYARPQLRVEQGDGRNQIFYPVSIDDRVEFLAGRPRGLSAAQFRDLRRFIILNREVLLAHWHDEIDSGSALTRIQHICHDNGDAGSSA